MKLADEMLISVVRKYDVLNQNKVLHAKLIASSVALIVLCFVLSIACKLNDIAFAPVFIVAVVDVIASLIAMLMLNAVVSKFVCLTYFADAVISRSRGLNDVYSSSRTSIQRVALEASNITVTLFISMQALSVIAMSFISIEPNVSVMIDLLLYATFALAVLTGLMFLVCLMIVNALDKDFDEFSHSGVINATVDI